MGNTLKMEKQALIKQLIAAGWSDRKIHSSTGLNRRPLSSYRKKFKKEAESESTNASQGNGFENTSFGSALCVQNAPEKCPPNGVVHFEVPPDPQKTGSRSNVSVYDEPIREKLSNGQNGRSIYQDLYVEEGYRGSYDSVKRYIRKLKRQSPHLFMRIETPPGEEVQVDFGEGAPTLKNGRYVRPWLFVMTLSYSRKSFQKVVWCQDIETFIRCHDAGFTHFGGVCNIALLDNLKSGVLKAHVYEPDLNPQYAAYSRHMGFIPLPCRVGTPRHKGKVESNIDYVQDNALKGKRFESLDEQNRYLARWNKTWADTRIHGTTKRQVKRMFTEESPTLKALPREPYAFFKIGTRKVSVMDSHIEVQGAYYPVSPRYMGQRVTVHYNSQSVKVYYQGVLIQHLSTIDKGHFHPDRSCLPASKTMDRNTWQKSILQRCNEMGSDVRHWADQVIKHRDLSGYRSIQGVLSLRKKYPKDMLNHACKTACERRSFTYKLVKHYLEEMEIKQHDRQTQLILQQEGEIIRSPRQYAELIGEVTL